MLVQGMQGMNPTVQAAHVVYAVPACTVLHCVATALHTCLVQDVGATAASHMPV